MACPSNMFKINSDQDCAGAFFNNPTPRISFSHDFADTIHHEPVIYKEAPVSSDFEFSVKNYYATIPADEIFFKGSMVPSRKTTLRDELLMGEEDDDDVSGQDMLSGLRGGWWTERWGLKKSKDHRFGLKRGKVDGMLLETVEEEKSNPRFISGSKKQKDP